MPHSTSDAIEIMDIEFGGDPGYHELRAQERAKSQASRAIYDARVAAGLAQAQLAQAVPAPDLTQLDRAEDHSAQKIDKP